MKTSRIYTDTRSAIRTHRRIVHQGGQWSGKTVNILGAIASEVAEKPIVATITSMSFPHLKAGALRDFERFVMPSFDETITKYRQTDHVVLFESGGLMEFKSYKDEVDARGGKRNILFINEANTFDYMTYFQLDSRSDVTIIDYNPSVRFWSHDKVIGEPGTKFLRSWHEHNPFLDARRHAEIEALCEFAYDDKGNVLIVDGKPVVLKGDYELWKVYARGITGNVKGVIFPDWIVIDDIEWTEPFFAVDFGYGGDPTAIVKIERRGRDIYVEEIAYEYDDIPPRRIRTLIDAHGYEDGSILYCEHDPDMIKQLKQLGVNAVAARKGAGSVRAGIKKLKEYRVYYIGRNLKNELSKYIWVLDEFGNPTNTPIDRDNHAIDATRMGVFSHFYRNRNQEKEAA